MRTTDDFLASLLGQESLYYDPVWTVETKLTALEQELLRTWDVRRLNFIAHAGGTALTTHQTYSRLSHSLGLLTLTAHFSPEDIPARCAALLHDIGHLPFSHTFEGLAGLNHHQLGSELILGLGPLLASHGVSAQEVLAVESGDRPSVLCAPKGALKLDHFESFIRSGHAHGTLAEPPRATLDKVRLENGAITTDTETAQNIAIGIVLENKRFIHPEVIIAEGVIHGLASELLSNANENQIAHIAGMTDQEFWNLLLTDERTAEAAQLLYRDPLSWQLCTEPQPGQTGSYEFRVKRFYLDMPCVDGTPFPIDAALIRDLPETPWHCFVRATTA